MLQNKQKEQIEKELNFSFARSGGSGGQHVNKTETKVILEFDVFASDALKQRQKKRILEKLGNRINAEGMLQIRVDEERSQLRNKKIALERFWEVLEKSLRKPKRRKKTKPPKSADKKRLEEKKKHAEKKKRRRNDSPGAF